MNKQEEEIYDCLKKAARKRFNHIPKDKVDQLTCDATKHLKECLNTDNFLEVLIDSLYLTYKVSMAGCNPQSIITGKYCLLAVKDNGIGKTIEKLTDHFGIPPREAFVFGLSLLEALKELQENNKNKK